MDKSESSVPVPFDIELKIGNAILPAHKFPLAVGSGVLSKLISQDPLLTQVQLPNVGFSPAVWSAAVRSMYDSKGKAIDFESDAVLLLCALLDALDVHNETQQRVERAFETDILAGGTTRKWQAFIEILALQTAATHQVNPLESESGASADRSAILQLDRLESSCIRIRDLIEASLLTTPALGSVITNALLAQCRAADLLRLLQQESKCVSAAEKASMMCRFLDLMKPDDESLDVITLALSTSFRQSAARFDTPLLLAILHHIQCDSDNEWLVCLLAQRSHELSAQNCAKIKLEVLTRILMQADQRWFASARSEFFGCAFYALIDGIAESRLAGVEDTSEVSTFLALGLSNRRAHDMPLLKWTAMCGAGTLPRDTFSSLLAQINWSRVSFTTLLELIDDENVPSRVLLRALARFTHSTMLKMHDGLAAARATQAAFADSNHKVVANGSAPMHAPAFNKVVASHKGSAGLKVGPPPTTTLRFADCAALTDLRRCVDTFHEPAASAAAAVLPRSVDSLMVSAAANHVTQPCAFQCYFAVNIFFSSFNTRVATRFNSRNQFCHLQLALRGRSTFESTAGLVRLRERL